MTQDDLQNENSLRLATARRKVRSFLNQIAILEASDHAHDGSRAALAHIKSIFENRANELAETPATSATVDAICNTVNVDFEDHTALLGLILRASNVRNVFEVYYPLSHLIDRVVPQAQLVLSSEWQWSPFTYPIGYIEKFVFIGSPATEAENVLIIPLAGHEIGHSAWVEHAVYDLIGADVADLITARAAPGDGQEDRSEFAQECVDLTAQQLEEVFCDLVGLYLFGDAYLYAYAHVLAPGGMRRSDTYPDAVQRVRYLEQAAETWRLNYQKSVFEPWQPSVVEDKKPARDVADEVVQLVVPKLIEITAKLLGARVKQSDESTVTAAQNCFQQRVPFAGDAKLSELLSAGWRALRAEGGLGGNDERAQCASLYEVVLKSIEVAEFERRLKYAQR